MSPPESALSSRLREVARQSPTRVLLDTGDETFSYADLDLAADCLAQRLLNDFGRGQQYVGIRTLDSHAMTLAFLAVARAGMVAVPIDPTAPLERVRSILGQVTPAVLLSDVAGDSELPVAVAHPRHLSAPPPPEGVVQPQADLVAITFTSGSTGVPKGIMITHPQRQGLVSHVERHNSWLRDSDRQYRVGSVSAGTVGFAHATLSHVVGLTGRLATYDVRRLGFVPFGDWLLDKQVTSIWLVPTVLRAALATLPEGLVLPELRQVTLVGETSTWGDARELRRHLLPEAHVLNLLSQTEVHISEFFVDEHIPEDATGPLPGGSVMPNRIVTTVGPDEHAVFNGTAGEIVVETAECALGYLGQPDVTASVFTELGNGRRRVRTGDAGRLLEDGTLEHLGRLDHVVKIAGNRVDIGDVETALRSINGVRHAAAATYTSPSGDIRLAGYVVASAGVSLHSQVVRSALARCLPGPMLPDFILVLDALPYLPNGKVDRKRLPGRPVEWPDRAQHDREPTPLEARLLPLFAEVLGVRRVGLDDDFFLSGGDSIRAARLFAAIERTLGIVRPVPLIVEAPTPSALASALDTVANAWEPLVPLRAEGNRPPLFVIHDGKGDVFYAQRLFDALGPDQPVFAIQPKGLLGTLPEETTIEALAQTYLRAVRRQRPRGPYLFYGYSLGGAIAFEMARQLRVIGETVAFVGMGDSALPNPDFARYRQPLSVRRAERLSELRALSIPRAFLLSGRLVGRQLEHFTWQWLVTKNRRYALGAVSTRRLMRQGRTVPPELRRWLITDHYGEMLSRYLPASRYDGNVLLIRGRSQDPRPDRGWAANIDGELRCVDVESDHAAMHDATHSTEVGRLLGAAIDLALAGTPPPTAVPEPRDSMPFQRSGTSPA